MYDVIVVGGGFAGVTAAREAATRRARHHPARGPRPHRRPHLDGAVAGRADRVRRRLGALAPAPHVVGDHARRPRGGSQRRRRRGGVVRGRRASLRHGGRARRDRPARLGQVRRRRRTTPSPPPMTRSFASTCSSGSTASRCESGWRSSTWITEERDVLAAELESVVHGRLEDGGAVSILRWHALSGSSLQLAQYTGGRVTLRHGTDSLLQAIAGGRSTSGGSRRRWLPWCRRAMPSRCTPVPATWCAAGPSSWPCRSTPLAPSRSSPGSRPARWRPSPTARPRAGSRSSSRRAARASARTRSSRCTSSATSTPRSSATTAPRS